MTKTERDSRKPLVAVLAVLVLGATAALLVLQACGDAPTPKAPNPTGSSTSSSAPTTPPPTNTVPPAT